MSRAKATELQQRVFDLEAAMQAMGRIVTDPNLTSRQRVGRCMGILQMYESLPAAPLRQDEGVTRG